jgi:Uma2 family endonuclease
MNTSASSEEVKRIAEALPEWIASRPSLRQRFQAALEATEDQTLFFDTYEAFLDWADEDVLAEWVKGEVILTSPASLRHQNIAGFLTTLIRTYAEEKGLGQVISAPFQMKLAHSGREPDLLFVAQANLHRLQPTYLDGPADLVIEIISPESIGRDRGDKYLEYEAAGIPEYWLIDPSRQQVEFYRLDENGRYQLSAPDENGRYHSSQLPGFWLQVDWLWQEPLPRILSLLRQLNVA